MDELKIKWRNGSAVIYMPEFFPCTIAKLKKLKKLIELDWEHCDNLAEQVKEYFEQMARICEETRKRAGLEYLQYKQNAADYPGNKNYTKWANSAKRTALKAKKQKEWFETQKERW